MFSFLLLTYSVTDHKTDTDDDGVLIKNMKSPLDKQDGVISLKKI